VAWDLPPPVPAGVRVSHAGGTRRIIRGARGPPSGQPTWDRRLSATDSTERPLVAAPSPRHGCAMHTPRLALLAALAATAVAASTAPNASAAVQRYASPTGTGKDCTSISPCDITEALYGGGSGDEVIVGSGDYPLTVTPAVKNGLTIHGVAGRPRPHLLFSGNQSGLFLPQGTVLRHVEIAQAEPNSRTLYSWGSTVDQVIVKGSAGTDCAAFARNSTIRDSIVVASGSGASAICTRADGPGDTSASSYRNVTAIATGSGGVAIDAYASGTGKVTVNLVNVIAQGGPVGASLAMTTDGSGAEATITARHSNWANYLAFGTNAQYVNLGGNQGTSPAFVDAAAGDYRQRPGSLTIDAGLDDLANGALDVDGDPRRVGTTDIGADELVPRPAATTEPAGAVTSQSAMVSGRVNPKDAPTTYRFEYGTTTAYGRSTPVTAAGSGETAVVAAATVGGLSPATTYHYRILATNAGGVTTGSDRTFTTTVPAVGPPATQPPATTPPAAQPPATTPPFPGIELASPKLTYARGAITVRLRCPAGTSGRCSGRTTLTARRPTSARRVSLGRAAFSIRPGSGASVKVRVTRAGRRLLRRASRPRGRAVNFARDGAGRSTTTETAVTIRHRRR
jgi:hypothetical protein